MSSQNISSIDESEYFESDLEKRLFSKGQLKQVRMISQQFEYKVIGYHQKKLYEEFGSGFTLYLLHRMFVVNGCAISLQSGTFFAFHSIPKPLHPICNITGKSLDEGITKLLPVIKQVGALKLEAFLFEHLRLPSTPFDDKLLRNNPKVILESIQEIRTHNVRMCLSHLLKFDQPTSALQDLIPAWFFHQYADGSRSIPQLYLFFEKIALVKIGLANSHACFTDAKSFIAEQEESVEGNEFIEHIVSMFCGTGPVYETMLSNAEEAGTFSQYVPYSLKTGLFWDEGRRTLESYMSAYRAILNEMEEALASDSLSRSDIEALIDTLCIDDQAKFLFVKHYDDKNRSKVYLRSVIASCNLISTLHEQEKIGIQKLSISLTRGLGYYDYHQAYKPKINTSTKSRKKAKLEVPKDPLANQNQANILRLLSLVGEGSETVLQVYRTFVLLGLDNESIADTLHVFQSSNALDQRQLLLLNELLYRS